MSARFWEAADSKGVPKGSQLSSQVVSFFVFFQTFCDDALLGPQAHTRAARRTQNVAPGDTKSTPGGQKQPLQEPKSSQAATSSDAQKQRVQRTLHLHIAPRSLCLSVSLSLRSRLCNPNPLLLIPFANDPCPNASLCVAKVLLSCSYARFAAPSLHFASPKPCFASTGVFVASCFALSRQTSDQFEFVRGPTTLLSVLT